MAISTSPLVISIGSGKGGVGKSFLLSNLGYLLAERGFRVVLIDLDLGGADLQIFLGMYRPSSTLSEYFTSTLTSLSSLVLPTKQHPNLFLIAGSGNQLANVQLSLSQKEKLSKEIKSLPFDMVLLDVGAGTHFDVLDFYLLGEIQLLLTTPEPPAMFDLSRFVKMTTTRLVQQGIIQNEKQRKQLDHQEFATVRELLEYTGKVDSDNRKKALALMRTHQPYLIVNRWESGDEKALSSLKKFLQRFSGRNDLLGVLSNDFVLVKQATKESQPVSRLKPDSVLAKELQQITKKMIWLLEQMQNPDSLYHQRNRLAHQNTSFAEAGGTLASSYLEEKSTQTSPTFTLHQEPKIEQSHAISDQTDKSLDRSIQENPNALEKSKESWIAERTFETPQGFRPIDIVGVIPDDVWNEEPYTEDSPTDSKLNLHKS